MSKDTGATVLEDVLGAALEDVMAWIENWSPDFTNDEDWPKTEERAKAALAMLAERDKP
jgi:hypothetical protein